MNVRLIEEIGTRAWLRIYWGTGCVNGHGHNAMRHITDSSKADDQGFARSPGDYSDPDVWPKRCETCGAPVPDGHFLNRVSHDGRRTVYQVHYDRLYNTTSGKPEPGDAYWAPHYHEDLKHHYCPWDNCDDPRGHLMVVCPDGWLWDTDSRASNCTMKDDRTHRCWVKHGEPPNLHVDKSGHTCQAGSGSIASPGGWHGFLHNGELR